MKIIFCLSVGNLYQSSLQRRDHMCEWSHWPCISFHWMIWVSWGSFFLRDQHPSFLLQLSMSYWWLGWVWVWVLELVTGFLFWVLVLTRFGMWFHWLVQACLGFWYCERMLILMFLFLILRIVLKILMSAFFSAWKSGSVRFFIQIWEDWDWDRSFLSGNAQKTGLDL